MFTQWNKEGEEKMELNSLCKERLISMYPLHRKGESHTSAKYTNASAHVEISGTAGNKEHYLSILPTIVRTFGPTFFFGAVFKLFHDILQFISPQILRSVRKKMSDDIVCMRLSYNFFFFFLYLELL